VGGRIAKSRRLHPGRALLILGALSALSVPTEAGVWNDDGLCPSANDSNSAAEWASIGRAHLAVGSPDRALAALQKAVAAAPADTSMRTDLARAYLARAKSGTDPRDFLAAADEARRAVEAGSPSAEAVRVRADTLEALGLPELARRVRGRAKPIEPGISDLRSSLLASPEERDLAYRVLERTLAPEWAQAFLAGKRGPAESALADALRLADALGRANGDRLYAAAFGDIQRRVAANDSADGLRTLATALRDLDAGYRLRVKFNLSAAKSRLAAARAAFDNLASPFEGPAALQLAICQLYLAVPGEARSLAEKGLPPADSNGFMSLRGQWHTLIGLLDVFETRLTSALHHYQSAIVDLAATGRAEGEFNARVNLADALGDLGEPRDEWRMRFSAHALLPRVTSPTLVSTELANSALRAFQQGFLGAALDFADVGVAAAESSRIPGNVVEARVWRAQIRIARGSYAGALDDLAVANGKLLAISEPALLDWMRGQVAIAKARALAGSNPRRSVDRWTDALRRFEKIGDDVWFAEIYLGRGRAYERAGHDELAGRDFEKGIRHFESSRSESPAGPLAISYFDRARDLFDAMIELQALRRNQPALALDYAERGRARSLRDSLERHAVDEAKPSIVETRDVLARIPEDAAVVTFQSVTGGVITWVARRDRLTQSFAPMPAAALDRAAVSVAEDFEPDSARQGHDCSSGLFDVLIRPSLPALAGVHRLVIVPDGATAAIPYSALRDRQTGRRLVEDFEIAIAPALSLLSPRAGPPRRPESTDVVVIGASTPDVSLMPALATLPGAALEVKTVAGLYGNVRLLSGDGATKARVLDAIRSARLVHYAGHAVSNPERPELSHLVLAQDAAHGESGLLLAREIEALDLSGCELVVLAACETGAGRTSPGEGPLSLARSFLVAGSGAVAVTLWDIGDIPSAFFARSFHELLLAGKSPPEALRGAQLACLNSQDPHLRDPRVWASFEVIVRSL